MKKIVDARGLTCPQPVILTKRVMDEGDVSEITTIVDNTTSLENVKKLANSQGYAAAVEEKDGEFHINLSKSVESAEPADEKGDEIAILITSSCFGRGEDELGRVLMKSFLYSLNEIQGEIRHLIFMNSGVFLTTEGSPVLDHLSALEAGGTEILSCGTCLDYYGLKEKLVIGRVTNMYTAMEIISGAPKNITL